MNHFIKNVMTAMLYLAVAAFACIGPFAIPVFAEGYMTGLGTVLLVPCLIGCPWVACYIPMIVLGGR